MGSGASKLSEGQKLIVTKQLKDLYEKCQDEKMDDATIQKKLTEEFTKSLATFGHDEPVKRKVVGVSVHHNAPKNPTKRSGDFSISTGGPSTLHKPTASSVAPRSSFSAKYNGNEKKRPTRRKSYDTSPVKAKIQAKVDQIAVATNLMNSVSEPELPAENVADSWDSVSEQPFCNTCLMAFKSMAFLERHLKYSDLHSKNLKRAEAGKSSGLDLPSTDEIKKLSEETAAPTKQLEGVHYKLLYTGAKFFWRYQKSIDFDLFHHILPHTIEVIGFDTEKHKEIVRIYLNYTIIASLLEGVINAEVDAIKKELANDRFADIPKDKDLFEETQASKIITYVLQRLLWTTGDSKKPPGVEFSLLSGDDEKKNPLLKERPLVVLPISVARRRRTNAEEIASTIDNIKTDHEAAKTHLHKANSLTTGDENDIKITAQRAQRISTIVFQGVHHFSTKPRWANMSVVKKRWLSAIDKVIRKNKVAKVKMNLYERFPNGIPAAEFLLNSPGKPNLKQQATAELLS